PTGQGPVGRLVYSGSATIDPATLETGSFAIVPPVIGGLEVPDMEVRWPRTARTGPASDTVSAGSIVRLGLVTANRPDAPAPTSRRWSATVFSGPHWFSRGGDGPPPPEIDIVTDEFAGPGGQIFAV